LDGLYTPIELSGKKYLFEIGEFFNLFESGEKVTFEYKIRTGKKYLLWLITVVI
jgi:hypothetical protein